MPRFRPSVAHVGVVLLLATVLQASIAASAGVSTTNAAEIAAFQAGRTVLGFDELVVPAGPCFLPLDSNQSAAQGILVSAKADGSAQTHLARLPECGHFGATQTVTNIIGGGTGAVSLGWRETIRFDFPLAANAIGAHTHFSGSNTTLTAYRANGTVIASVSRNQGNFLGITEPDIAYAIWTWNFDQGAAGYSLDNMTFSLAPQVPSLSWIGYTLLTTGLGIAAYRGRTS